MCRLGGWHLSGEFRSPSGPTCGTFRETDISGTALPVLRSRQNGSGPSVISATNCLIPASSDKPPSTSEYHGIITRLRLLAVEMSCFALNACFSGLFGIATTGGAYSPLSPKAIRHGWPQLGGHPWLVPLPPHHVHVGTKPSMACCHRSPRTPRSPSPT